MTLWRLAFAQLRANPMTSAVNALLMALGTAAITVLMLVGAQLGATATRDARGIDLVLGAKGSPFQLVLSSVYHADVPTGNILLEDAQRWARDARVAAAVPLALGDSYRGFRIVGTEPAYLDWYEAKLQQGRRWQQPMEAVLGATVARDSGRAPGDTLVGAHGLTGSSHDHGGHPYRVVGVLAPTGMVIDRLVLTSVDSVWELHAPEASHADEGHAEEHEHEHEHEHEDEHEHAHERESPREITAMLLRYASPLAATSLPRQVNMESSLQAASPAFELSRMLSMLGLGLDGLRAFAALLIVGAGLSVFAALYGALCARQVDLAVLRCLGASRGELFWTLLLEGLLLTVAGTLFGLLAGHALVEILGRGLAQSRGIELDGGRVLFEELGLVASMMVIGVMAAVLPAWQALRTDVARTLARA